jgi:uncharacterized protein (DUF3820 family)
MTAAVKPEESTAVAVVPSKGVMRLLRPVAEPAEIVEAQNAMRAMVHQALKEGRDYGKIPGTDKPTLLKPGAERVALGFGCYYGEPVIIEKEIDHDREVRYTKRKKIWRNQFHGDRHFDWQEEAGVSQGLYRYVVRVPVVNRETGDVVGAGVGACSSMESKYIDRPRDCENTVLKMAHKRAIVSAALVTFGLSDEFTQDVEDIPTAAAAAKDSGEPPITRESQWPFGKYKNTPVKELPDDFLLWAIGDGRKFGKDTAQWQAILKMEAEQRKTRGSSAQSEGSPANSASSPSTPSDADWDKFPRALEEEADDLPF